MSKGNTFENDLLKLIFNGTSISDLAMNDSSDPLTNLYVALHTDDPGEDGNQETNEADYTGYARVAVLREAAGWTVNDNEVVNTAAVTFGACSDGENTITHFSVGTSSSGAGKILYSGQLVDELGDPASFEVTNGIIPTFPIGDISISES